MLGLPISHYASHDLAAHACCLARAPRQHGLGRFVLEALCVLGSSSMHNGWHFAPYNTRKSEASSVSLTLSGTVTLEGSTL